MIIDSKLIQKLANLSGLQLSAKEQDLMQHDLQKMLDFVHRLKEIDTTGVAPLQHMSQASGVERKDSVRETLTQAEALKGAPGADSQYFRVPKVINK